MAKAKKDFTAANTGRVYAAIADATAEPAQDAQKTQDVLQNEQTIDTQDALQDAQTQETQDEQQAQDAPKAPKTRKPRREYTAEELEAAREAGKTRGRKGAAAVRFNMSFTPAVYDYIVTMARVRGETVTAFTNYVFRKSMEDNAELYEQAKAFRDSFK